MTEGKRDTSKKRNSILDAAVKIFQKEGYDTASMDRIAEVAKASKRTVYNHFESKEVLFQAVVDRLMEQAHSLKNIPYNPARSLEDQLSDFAQVKLTFVNNPKWMGLMKVATAVFIRDPKLAKATMDKAMAGEDTLVTWIKAAVQDGKLRIDNPELAANVFWSMVSGALFWPQLFQEAPDPATSQTLKNELIQVFLSRYRA